MASRIDSVQSPKATRRIRRRRAEDSAPASAAGFAKASENVDAAAPIPPGGVPPEHAAPAVSAQLMGQSDSAEGAAPAKSTARQARSAYLSVEWSGPHDRRTRRGRIAKTDV